MINLLKTKLLAYLTPILITLFISLLGIIGFQKIQNLNLESDLKDYDFALKESIKISNENLANVEIIRKQKDKEVKSLTSYFKNKLANAEKYNRKIKEVSNAEENLDGPIANIVIDTLNWLQPNTVADSNKNSEAENTR